MKKGKVLGVGSALLDILANVDDDFLKTVGGEKGGMVMIDAETADRLIRTLPPFQKVIGGSAANTIAGLQKLGMPTAFLGKVGTDAEGNYYRGEFERMGGDVSRFKTTPEVRTGRCISLITPDSERTMRTDLGAAATFKVTEITADDFRDAAHLHIEGYMMFNMDVFLHVLKLAKDRGATVSLDLASFEIVRTFRDRLDDILRRYVDVVFANEDEAREFLGLSGSFDPQETAAALQEYCDVAAVKLGKQGACLRAGRETVFVKSELVTAVDTTGAGDLWQAGFLYAWLNGCSLETAGKMGAILGAEVVQVIGASIPPYRWEPVKARFQKLIYRS